MRADRSCPASMCSSPIVPAVMDHRDRQTVEHELQRGRHATGRDVRAVVVAEYRVQRRERGQLVQRVRRADVAGVQDQVDAVSHRATSGGHDFQYRGAWVSDRTATCMQPSSSGPEPVSDPRAGG
jgi:G:T/U-mismatch repair DNA glycosylase